MLICKRICMGQTCQRVFRLYQLHLVCKDSNFLQSRIMGNENAWHISLGNCDHSLLILFHLSNTLGLLFTARPLKVLFWYHSGKKENITDFHDVSKYPWEVKKLYPFIKIMMNYQQLHKNISWKICFQPFSDSKLTLRVIITNVAISPTFMNKYKCSRNLAKVTIREERYE